MIGIYKITNISSKKVYIGQSKNIGKRWNEHIKLLENGKHHSIKLQRSWNKSGRNKFKFEIIEECSIEVLDSREQYWINYYDSINNGFNIVNVGEISKTTKKKVTKEKSIKKYKEFIEIYNILKSKLNCKIEITCKFYEDKLLNNKYKASEYSKVINLITFILNHYNNKFNSIISFKIDRNYTPITNSPMLAIVLKNIDGNSYRYLKSNNVYYEESDGERKIVIEGGYK